ncbi:MAG: prenyltransferase/squalene oxidase repeat-containing protein [Candidatus Helarchaeota archaeon]
MSVEYQRILPFWKLPSYKLKSNFKLLRAQFQKTSKYISNEYKKAGEAGFGTLEKTFWGVLAAYYLNKLDVLNPQNIQNYIFKYRSPEGGFFSEKSKAPDTHSTFFAIASLRLLGLDLNEDEKQITVKFILRNQKNNGFTHCNDQNCKFCDGKTSVQSTFYAISSLYLINKLDQLETNLAMKYLSKRLPKSNIFNSYIILADILVEGSPRIDEKFSYLLEFQQEDGSFREKEAGEEDLENSFWLISCLKAIKLDYNRGIVLDKFLQKLKRKDGGYNKQPLNTESDLIDTAQAVAIESLLLPDLTEKIENDILKSLSSQKEIFLKNIADANFVEENFVIKILNKLAEYDWFSVDLIRYKDLIERYLKKLGIQERKLASKIITKLRKLYKTSIDLGDFAKSLKIPVSRGSSYLPNEEVVIKSISKLIENKFIIGELEETRKRLKKTTYLNLQFVPDHIVVRKKGFDYSEIMKEKDNLNNVDRHIKELIEAGTKLPEEFQMEIKNLLDVDEVELARVKLETSYKQASNKLEDYNKSINFLINNFKYLSVEPLDSYQDWVKISKKIEKELQSLRKDLEKNIEDKEKLIDAYNKLNELVDYVEQNISQFNKDMDNLNSFFIDTCRLHSLDKKKQAILVKISSLEDNIKKIASEINVRSKEIAHITEKVRFLKNVIISDDLSVSKRIITHELKEKLQPFENWLETQWNTKRHITHEKLEKIKSKIHKRDELKNILESRKKTFNVKLDAIPGKIHNYISQNKYELANQELNNSITEVLKFLTDTTEFIQDYITDTNKLLEDFELAAEDIPIKWKESMEQMRVELGKMKSEVLKQIISEQEMEKKNRLDEKIDMSIDDVSKKLTAISELTNIDHEKMTISMKDLLKNKIKVIEDFCDDANDEITSFIKTTSSDFPNFQDTINISIHKWKTFLNSLPSVFNQVKDQTLENFAIKVTKSLSKPENGGRVKFEDLSRILGINVNQVKTLLEKLISVSNLEAEFEEKQVIPLSADNKLQLQFEETIDKFQEEVKLNFDKISNFFITSYERKQLDNNESEIRNRIQEFKKSLNQATTELKEKYNSQIKNPYNEQIMFNWGEIQDELKSKLENIINILDKRNEYKNLFLEKLQKFRDQLEVISNFILEKIQDKNELPKLIEKLSTRVDELRFEILNQENSFKNNITELSRSMEHFDKIIEDAHLNYISESGKVLSDLKNLKRRLEDKILERQQEAEKEKLKEKIGDHEREFRELVDVMDKEVYNIIETGNLSEAATTLKQSYDNLRNYIKTADNSIYEFIKMNSKNFRNFKNVCVLILRDWNKEELEAHLNKAFIILQDRIVIRNIEYAERAFHGNRVKVDQLASKINMKTKIFKERLFDILGTSEELKGKLDIKTNEYVFRPDEEPKLVATTAIVPAQLNEKKSFFDILGEWAPIFTIIGGLAGTSYAVYNFTQSILLAGLIFGIGLVVGLTAIGIYYKITKK